MKRFLVRLLKWLTSKELSEDSLRLAKLNGLVIEKNSRAQTSRQYSCNHRKGNQITVSNGRVTEYSMKGRSEHYAVIKHQFSNGDVHISCLRCGKKWKPPVRPKWYRFKEVRLYKQLLREYQEALEFPTFNTNSGSLQYRFKDGGAAYAKMIGGI